MALIDLPPETASLASGIELAYVREGSGLPLIFIHGAMGDWRSWGPQWEAFTPYYDCIAYSRRYAFPNPNELDTFDHSALIDAEDLLGLMDALGLSQAILVGSSYGGFTALAAAVKAPERVVALVSVEAPMMRYAEMSPEGAAIVSAFKAASADPARHAFLRGEDELGLRILTGGIVGKPPEQVPEHIIARRMYNLRAARSLAISNDEFPLLSKDQLGALAMPIYLMSGAETAPIHDAIFQQVLTAMPQAKSLKVAGAGHSVSQQQPKVFNAEVLSFLQSMTWRETRGIRSAIG